MITVAGSRIQYPCIESLGDYGFQESDSMGTCPPDLVGGASLKNEETWWRVLSHYDAEYDSTQEIDMGLHTGWWHRRHSLHDNGPPVTTATSHISSGTTGT